jgi:hypothetical protein
MVEGVERQVGLDLEFEAFFASAVADADRNEVCRFVPKQVDVEPIAGAVGQLGSSGDRRRGHRATCGVRKFGFVWQLGLGQFR